MTRGWRLPFHYKLLAWGVLQHGRQVAEDPATERVGQHGDRQCCSSHPEGPDPRPGECMGLAQESAQALTNSIGSGKE